MMLEQRSRRHVAPAQELVDLLDRVLNECGPIVDQLQSRGRHDCEGRGTEGKAGSRRKTTLKGLGDGGSFVSFDPPHLRIR